MKDQKEIYTFECKWHEYSDDVVSFIIPLTQENIQNLLKDKQTKVTLKVIEWTHACLKRVGGDQGHGQCHGHGHGQDHGRGQDHGHGHGYGQSHGHGYGQSHGQGHGHGHGHGRGQGHGYGRGQGHGYGQSHGQGHGKITYIRIRRKEWINYN